MRETIIRCDRCGRPPMTSFEVDVDKDLVARFDLCADCAVEGFRQFLDSVSMQAQRTRDILEDFLGHAPEVH